MLERTHIPEAPWWVVQAVDKKRARLNCIHHLLRSGAVSRDRACADRICPRASTTMIICGSRCLTTMIVPEIY